MIRIINGAALGYLSDLVVVDKLAALVAFGLGVMPIKESIEWVKEKTKKFLEAKDVSAIPPEPPSLQHLQGATEDILESLREQRITSTQQLAYANPTKLFARTNIQLVVVLDLIDQAVLFNYFGEKSAMFRQLGIRGSIEMATLHRELRSSDAAELLNAEKTLASIVTVLSIDENALRHTIHTLYEDITVNLLARLFGSHMRETAKPAAPMAMSYLCHVRMDFFCIRPPVWANSS